MNSNNSHMLKIVSNMVQGIVDHISAATDYEEFQTRRVEIVERSISYGDALLHSFLGIMLSIFLCVGAVYFSFVLETSYLPLTLLVLSAGLNQLILSWKLAWQSVVTKFILFIIVNSIFAQTLKDVIETAEFNEEE